MANHPPTAAAWKPARPTAGGSCPTTFLNWKTVFWRWRKARLWQKIHDALRERLRVVARKKATPTAAIIDSQSVKTTEVGGEERGYDAGKKINGRKRHIVVDTLGLVLAVVVQSIGFQIRTVRRQVGHTCSGRFDRRTDPGLFWP